ncbi:carboxyltransferase domain-containing protein [uncultured Brevibacterium sp.]|uniref:5-oxoprolinase subunit B/C family protein n=1 Tax=uncultured Brevibacterium sp. TaxID=189678 RepID=UPI0025FA7CB9|nr:carboxyltransferase domain-containing protein [uncultured Brevibacterium sp.]
MSPAGPTPPGDSDPGLSPSDRGLSPSGPGPSPGTHPSSTGPGGALALHRVGTRAVLVDLPDLDTVMAWHAALTADPLPAQRGIVAAASTLLFTAHTPDAATRAFELLRDFAPETSAQTGGREITLDVVYDGEDLAPLAEHLGLSPEALVEKHTAKTWTGAFGGFAPGFTYCVPAAGGWDVPRRESPRTAVPPGSVALAGEFSAVYPRRTPGGWQLIGRTDTPMWDESADPPALIAPGDTVRYRAVRPTVEAGAGAPGGTEPASSDNGGPPAEARPGGDASATPPQPVAPSAPAAPGRPVLRVEDAGLLTLIEDLGRAGYGDLGVASSGVLDRASAWTANRLVGNGGASAVLESIGGLRVTALVDTVVTVTGAEAPLTVAPGRASGAGDPRRHPLAHPLLLRAGDELTVGGPRLGMRSYLAVRGGFAAHRVLGSAATDLLSGLGPEPVRTGDTLRVRNRPRPAGAGNGGEPAPTTGSAPGAPVNATPLGTSPADAPEPETGAIAAVAAPAPNPLRVTGVRAVLRCIMGPRADWFDAAEQARFTQVPWQVSGRSNRIGLRLEPGDGAAPLTRSRDGELASEGMITGAVQVPPDGNPVLFLADHPVTGGYPVIATVVAEDLDIAGQLPPGSAVTFTPVDPVTLTPLAAAGPEAASGSEGPAGSEDTAGADAATGHAAAAGPVTGDPARPDTATPNDDPEDPS